MVDTIQTSDNKAQRNAARIERVAVVLWDHDALAFAHSHGETPEPWRAAGTIERKEYIAKAQSVLAAANTYNNSDSTENSRKPILIPSNRALIGWRFDPKTGYADTKNSRNWQGPLRVGEVFVLLQDTERYPDDLGPREWQDLDVTHGACEADWMKPGMPWATPEGVFADILTEYGVRDFNYMARAIRQFAQIEECAWARQMAAVLDPDLYPAEEN